MGRRSDQFEAIHAQFPSIRQLDWAKVFAMDLGLWALVWRDVMKQDQAESGRPGPRPSLDPKKGTKRFLQMTGEDYTMLPFPEAIRILSRNASVRALAAQTGIERNTIHRLLTGSIQPDLYEMEQAAKAFGKHPSYFLEYRISTILAFLHAHMLNAPESSVTAYNRVNKALKEAKVKK